MLFLSSLVADADEVSSFAVALLTDGDPPPAQDAKHKISTTDKSRAKNFFMPIPLLISLLTI